MANRKINRPLHSRATANGNGSGNGNAHANGGSGPSGPEWSGRYVVLMRHNATDKAKVLHRDAGLRVECARDFEGRVRIHRMGNGDAMFFDKINAALVDSDPDRLKAIRKCRAVLSIEPERVLRVTNATPGVSSEYVRDYPDAVNKLTGKVAADGTGTPVKALQATPAETFATWGLRTIGVLRPNFTGTGAGIRVAVLDSGIDFQHPDFKNRVRSSQSFITGEPPQDGNGHGTHCTGTLCGPFIPAQLPRYGVAPDVELFVGKILSDSGFGGDGSMLAGMDWALRNECHIISMSIHSPVQLGAPFSQQIEILANRILDAGTLIIAAAGNHSSRPQLLAPVSHPANCPSILAVAAVDKQDGIAPDSDAGLNGSGGEVNIAGPGVAVISAWPFPPRYLAKNGTSMATPHVAGIAALLAEANPNVRGRDLQALLLKSARALAGLPPRDVGVGMVQAP